MIFRSRAMTVLLFVATFAAYAKDQRSPGLDLPDEPKPVYRLEPEPMDPAELPPPHESIEQDDPSAELAPKPDPRPVVDAFTCDRRACSPCGDWEDWHSENAESSAFRFNVVKVAKLTDLPDWVQKRGAPCFRFATADGDKVAYSGWWGEEHLIRYYLQHNPGVMLAAPPKSIVEQLAKFLGPEGSIVVQPEKPVTAILEDGTKISYSRVSVKYAIKNGIPSWTFDPPLVRADSRYWGIHVGAQILDGKYEPPSTIAIGTTAGRYRITLEESK